MKVHGTFYCHQTTATAFILWGNFYKVYAVDDAFHFARVGDKSYIEMAKDLEKYSDGVKADLEIIVVPGLYHQWDMEDRYDALEIGGAEFLNLHKRNFSVRRGEILKATMQKKPFVITSAHKIGVLELFINNGKRRKFIVSGEQTVAEVEQIIRQVVPAAEGSFG